MTLRVDGFTEVSALAGGGFGSVYRAVRASTGGVVALKVLDRAQGDDDQLLERRLRRELAALVALKGHPNVVQVEQVVSTANGPAIVMEFMARGSVLESDRPGATKPNRVAFVAAAVSAGLQAAHDNGIVHRDVKPQNILVNNFGQVKLCDFGIAAISRSAEFRTHTSALSVRYASPEELDNAPDIGPPTDVYSLGASMFHLMYGEPPSFRGRRGADPALLHRDRGRDANADEVAAIIADCLQQDPAARPTANDCFGLFSEVGSRAVEARAEEDEPEPPSSTTRRPSPAGDDDDPTDPNARRPPLPNTGDVSMPSPVSPDRPLPSASDEGWWR